MLDKLEWPSLEARRDRSSLLLFHKINSGAVSIEKDKYLTPVHSLKTTRASHSAQYCRYQTYGDVLKNSFSPNYSTVEWSPGGGGTLNFSIYIGSGLASTLHIEKISGISSTPKKIFEIFATPKISPFCTMTLRIDPKIHRNDP